MTTLEKLIQETEQFLAAVRRPLSPNVYRDYLLCLENLVRQLPDGRDVEEIEAAMESLSQCDYADSTNMVFMNQVVIPEIEYFLSVIQQQESLCFAH